MATEAGDPEARATWDGDAERARVLRQALAARIRVRDGFPVPLRTVAGFEARPIDDGRALRAVAVLVDAATLAPLEVRSVRVAATLPDIADVTSFRVLPALLRALASLSRPPDLALVAGDGIAHPQRFGLACHFGLATGLATVGVATAAPLGTARLLHRIRGAHTPLRDGPEQIGWLLRSRVGCDPLVVSSGHRVSMAAAPALAMQCTADDRLPEPLRRAHVLAVQADA